VFGNNSSYKRFLIVDLKEFLVFFAGLIFETVLLDA
jgi:hypothetical protein